MQYLPVIAIIISILAFALSAYSLYLQRKDKKPLLKVKAKRDLYTVPVKQDERGGWIYGKQEVICLEVSNPTEREINIKSVEFAADGKNVVVKPYKKVEKLASHNQGEIIIRDELKDGYFIVSDALGNQFKSNRI